MIGSSHYVPVVQESSFAVGAEGRPLFLLYGDLMFGVLAVLWRPSGVCLGQAHQVAQVTSWWPPTK